MVKQRAALKEKIKSYVPVTVDDVIHSMTFYHPDGDRVQTSNTSDKTCTVALNFRDRTDRMNGEAIGEWVKEYDQLDEEISFLEECIRRLPGDLRCVMEHLVLDGASWEAAAGCLCMSRKAIWFRRQEALQLLTLEYQKRASMVEAVILG